MSVSESALSPRRQLVLADVLPGDRVRAGLLPGAWALVGRTPQGRA